MRRMSNPAALLALSTVWFLGGCATIVGGGPNQPVSFQSTPAAASFTIQSSSGLQMGQGNTPATLTLPRRNEYQVQISLDGYQTQSAVLTKGVNGWIWGNLLFGWIVGFIVDFATGSAYKLEPATVQVGLVEGGADLWAEVRFFDEAGRIITEQRLKMIPEG